LKAQGTARSWKIPLYAKILFYLFLNVLLVSLFAYLCLTRHFGITRQELQRGIAASPLRAVAEVITKELNAHPRKEWYDVLARYRDSCDANFTLFQADGKRIVGCRFKMPPEIKDGIANFEQAHPNPSEGTLNSQGPILAETTGKYAAFWIAMPLQLKRFSDGPRYLLVRSSSGTDSPLLHDSSPWLWTAAGSILISLIFWIPIVYGITSSIRKMKEATGRIASGEFCVSVDQRRKDEIGELGASVNLMAQRLQKYVSQQRSFLGDISHELCAPLSRAQMALGNLEIRTPDENQAYLEDLSEEMSEMSSLVSELLDFSKASFTEQQSSLESVSLQELADRVRHKETEGHEGDFVCDIPADLKAMAIPHMLERALGNIIRNAIRYASEYGAITLRCTSCRDYVNLEVHDNGKGVPEDSLPYLFDPLFRLESCRTRDQGGHGLGLAIVKSCVEACSGRVSAFNRERGGFVVRIRLMRALG